MVTINKNSITEFPQDEAHIQLKGPSGQLEVLTTQPTDALDITAVICHPHPLFGGTMHNKVVYTIARAFKEMKIRTVRFNYRGVGASEGTYAQGIGETDDLLAIAEWVKQVRPQDKIWLAGFSFGCFVAARGAQVLPASQLVTVAPAVENFNFEGLEDLQCPWLIIQGDSDEVVSPQAVKNWVQKIKNQPKFIVFPDTSHFFHGKLVELRQTLISELSPQL